MERMNSESRMDRVPVILLVEDEDTVLQFMRRVLEADGNVVLTARNSVEALHVGAAFRGTIDVLLTDVRMRVFQNGLELAKCFNVLRPETAVLLTSGSCLPEGGANEETDWSFLPKPFSAPLLLDAVGDLTMRPWHNWDWIPVTSKTMDLA